MTNMPKDRQIGNTVFKIAAAATGCYQPLDVSPIFKLLHDEMYKHSADEESDLFKEVEGLFETARNDQVLLSKNRGLVKKIIGIVSKVPDVVQKTCSKTNIIKGFVLCGDLSMSKDGKKVHPISNLNSIMERCDVNWDEDYITYSPEGDEINHGPLRDYFKSLIPEALQASKDYGEIPESFYDSRLPLDQTPSGDDYLRTSGPLAYSVRRAMIVHHKSHRDFLNEKTEEAKIRSTEKREEQ
jgi:hypothetical protein